MDLEFATRNGQTERDNFSRKPLKGFNTNIPGGYNLLPEYLELELLVRRKKTSLAKGIAKKTEKTKNKGGTAI